MLEARQVPVDRRRLGSDIAAGRCFGDAESRPVSEPIAHPPGHAWMLRNDILDGADTSSLALPITKMYSP